MANVGVALAFIHAEHAYARGMWGVLLRNVLDFRPSYNLASSFDFIVLCIINFHAASRKGTVKMPGNSYYHYRRSRIS